MYRRRKAWTPDCLLPGDRADYDALPERFTVYRGGDARFAVKNAWTLDLEVAEGFATGFRFPNKEPEVLTATTTKRNVALYHGDRKESEIVVFRRPRIDWKATRHLPPRGDRPGGMWGAHSAPAS
jgi:hypothetical protein